MNLLMTPLATIVIFLSMVANVAADGKMFWKVDLPSGTLPDQRAIIFHHDGKQTLLVQSMVKSADGTTPDEVAWVIPVPAVPEVGAIDEELGGSHAVDPLFRSLSAVSRPQIYSVSEYLMLFARIAWLFIPLILLIEYRRQGEFRSNHQLVFFGWLVLLLPILGGFSSFGGQARGFGVEVVSSGRLGHHDFAVVRSEKADALVSWLRDRKYAVGPADETVISQYVKQGWCFVATRLDTRREGAQSQGLAAPLILRFPSADPVYPMALTGSGGYATKVLLHVFADHPVNSNGKITRRFSGPNPLGPNGEIFRVFAAVLKPESLLPESAPEFALPWLTTFQQTLQPHEMSEDILLRPSKEAKPYRRVEWQW